MDYMEVVKKRRSIRKFKSESIPDEKVNKILEAARLSPSWANMQCWRFIVVKDEATKEAIKATIPSGNPGKETVTQAPVLIVLCANPERSGYVKGEKVDDRDWYLVDSGIVIEQILLAATNEGLASFCEGYFDKEKVKEILSVPEEMDVIVFITLGQADEKPKTQRRKSLEELVYYEKYGTSK
jgi:nitroreductase